MTVLGTQSQFITSGSTSAGDLTYSTTTGLVPADTKWAIVIVHCYNNGRIDSVKFGGVECEFITGDASRPASEDVNRIAVYQLNVEGLVGVSAKADVLLNFSTNSVGGISVIFSDIPIIAFGAHTLGDGSAIASTPATPSASMLGVYCGIQSGTLGVTGATFLTQLANASYGTVGGVIEMTAGVEAVLEVFNTVSGSRPTGFTPLYLSGVSHGQVWPR